MCAEQTASTVHAHVSMNNGAAIGSGGAHAGAASRALRDVDGMDAQTIGDQGMTFDRCVRVPAWQAS